MKELKDKLKQGVGVCDLCSCNTKQKKLDKALKILEDGSHLVVCQHCLKVIKW